MIRRKFLAAVGGALGGLFGLGASKAVAKAPRSPLTLGMVSFARHPLGDGERWHWVFNVSRPLTLAECTDIRHSMTLLPPHSGWRREEITVWTESPGRLHVVAIDRPIPAERVLSDKTMAFNLGQSITPES